MLPATGVAAKKKAKPITISVLSSRADLVSGGSALLRIGGVKTARGLKVIVGRKSYSKRFAKGTDGYVEGLVRLGVGRAKVVARTATRAATITLTGHRNGGPVFTGPQIQPWTCQAGAKDKQCNAAPVVTYKYLPAGVPPAGLSAAGSSVASPLQTYDPKSPPADSQIATTTTDTGKTVPFIVRQRTGYTDRDQYTIAELYQPGKAWTPVKPQGQFNRKLVLMHGASCDTAYNTGSAPDVLDTKLLAHGYAIASHALDNAGHNCNLITEAESLLMTKELVIKQLGAIKWTIGSGCSGGSLVQQQVANAYPGVYQAITPQCSFTDAWTSAMQYEDYVGLLAYFENPSRWDPGSLWAVPTKISAVIGHPNVGNPITFTTAIPNSGDPSRSCPGVPANKVFDPKTNPKGVKCTLQDYMVNVFGKRKDGFANRAFGNDGVQYGLDALRSSAITSAEFVDLNSHAGGIDINGDIDPAHRSVADRIAVRRAYTTGAVDSANNLDKVAIIDLRGPDPGAFHDVYRTYALRARLMRNFGTAANQVLWRGQAPLIGDPSYADDAVLAADTWVARYKADKRKVSLARKIREDKPGSVTERCTNGAGTALASEVCDQTVARYATPRLAADMPPTDDVLDCRHKALRKDDYPVTFTAAQWASLQKAFPTGVCDYSKPGVDQHGATAWLTYQTRTGKVIYGGRKLGAAPKSRAVKVRKKRKK